jgi:hypothetical protein
MHICISFGEILFFSYFCAYDMLYLHSGTVHPTLIPSPNVSQIYTIYLSAKNQDTDRVRI